MRLFGEWCLAIPRDLHDRLTLLFDAENILPMKESLDSYPLSKEELNLVQVFMLLYGYETVEQLLSASIDELSVHKDWNEEIQACIQKMKAKSLN
jgi:hypothetical protein